MNVYLAEDAALIRSLLPLNAKPPGDDEALFLGYAVLMRAKGLQCTAADVHDTWAAWMLQRDPRHRWLVPFGDLPPDTQEEDLPYLHAIHEASRVRRPLH
jgi:hypothetical protein